MENFKMLGVILSLTFLISCCSQKQLSSRYKSPEGWVVGMESYPDAGFMIRFEYPETIKIASTIDNCISFGIELSDSNEFEANEQDNTRQWSICLHDTVEYSSITLFNSWKSTFSNDVIVESESVEVDRMIVELRTIKSGSKMNEFRQLLYFEKFSTLFEVINKDESTLDNFKIFCKSINIEEIENKK